MPSETDRIDQRRTLATIAAERGASFAELSRIIGRNPAYVQQFVERGSPRTLAERDRRMLARYLGVEDAALGGPAYPTLVAVPLVDGSVSAGPGGLLEDDRATAALRLDADLLRALGVRADAVSAITVRGESMRPTLSDGDTLLVDTADRRLVADGVHVLRHDGLLLVKRLARTAGGWRIVSDNPAYPPVVVADPAAVDVVGRVVWMSRRL